MKAGAVVVDVAIDQGGCFETSHPTTHSDPVYVVDGVTHYCVANMPGGVPITATKALTNATLPYVEAIAGLGLREAVAPIRSSRRASTCWRARSPTRQWPRRTASTTRRSPTRSRSSARSGRCGFVSGARRGRDLHDDPREARGERDHAGDEDDKPEQAEDGVHRRRIASAARVRDRARRRRCGGAAGRGRFRRRRLGHPGNVARAVGGLDLPTLRRSARQHRAARGLPTAGARRRSRGVSSNARREKTRPSATGS